MFHVSELVNNVALGEQDRPRRFSASMLLVPLLVIAVILLVLELIPANEYMLLPGDALPVSPMIDIKGHRAVQKPGTLYLTDVSLYKVNHLLEHLYGKFNSDAELQPATQFSGGLSETQYLKLNSQMMDDSIHQAEAAALSTLNRYHPRFAATGPKIVFLVPRFPAQKTLQVGDVIEYVGKVRVHRSVQVSPLVSRTTPGHPVRLGILRHSRLQFVDVGTKGSRVGKGRSAHTVALMGIYVQDQIIFPVKIAINAGNIGGPSAGLMFSLGIIQRLSPQDITHGCKVAGTGTIDAYGTVGPIGGAKQKIIAARHAGAQYFLVPTEKDNLVPALQNRGDVTVLPVKTLAGALADLRRLKPCR
ncbi:MAG: PDZ domain-containing protein [Chloroflexota bacterium]